MTDFAQDLTGYLSKGLVRTEGWGGASQGLLYCKGLKVLDNCLVRPIPLNPLLPSAPSTPVWPHPNLFAGREVMLLCYSTSIYELVDGAWVLLTLKDPTTGLTSAITSTGVWTFADMGYSFVLSNGTSAVFRLRSVSTNTYVQNAAPASDSIIHQGRLICVGLSETFLEGAHDPLTTLYSGSIAAPASNWIWYSSIGAPEATAVFDPTPSLDSFTTMRGESHAHTALVGPCISALPDREFVYLFGAYDIRAMQRVSQPMPMYGFGEHLREGIFSRSSAAVGRGGCLVLTKNCQLILLNGFEVTRLDYAFSLSAFATDNEDVIIVYYPRMDEFYISNSKRSFCLTKDGLTEQNYSVLYALEDLTDSFLDGLQLSTNAAFSIITDTIIPTSYELVKVMTLELRTRNITGLQAGIYYRTSVSGSYTFGGWVPVGPDGIAWIRTVCVDYRVAIKGTTDEYGRIEGLRSRIEYASSRATRGPRGTKTYAEDYST